MKLKELAKSYGFKIDEDSCPRHVFNELSEKEVDKVDKKYKIGELILPYCQQDDCENCWEVELPEVKEEWIAEITERDSEIWQTDIEGNSREDIIQKGMKYAKQEGVESFRIGEIISVGVPNVDIDSILEDAYNQVYDEVGESAEGFLDNVSDEQEKELEAQLNDVFYNWIIENKLEPTCYTVINDEVIEVK